MNGHVTVTQATQPVNAQTVTLEPGHHDQAQIRWTGALKPRIVREQGRMLARNSLDLLSKIKLRGKFVCFVIHW